MDPKKKIDEIVVQCNGLIENLEYEKAKELLEEAFKLDPSRIEIIDLIAEVYFNLDNLEGAIKMYKKSISIDPEHNPSKYMTLAQIINDPKKSVQSYTKGIELYIAELEKNKNNMEIRSQIASGFASIAEKYMNSDLCEEQNAEEMVEKSIQEGLKYDPESIDVLLQLSNVRIIRKRDAEAEEALNKIQDIVKKMDDNEEGYPDRDMLMNISKNFAEIERYEKAIEVLDIVKQMNDQDIEVTYYLALYHYNIKEYEDSAGYISEINEAHKKLQKEDITPLIQDCLEAANELYKKLDEMGFIDKAQQNEEDVEMK